MSCKIVVNRFGNGTTYRGDVIGIYPSTKYLGKLVEPKGGAFAIIEITDKDVDSIEMLELLEPGVDYEKYDKMYYILEPEETTNPFLDDLLKTGRTTGTYSDLAPWIGEHV
tara:strand:+ start:18653 stop:18985 length:333 start_codon:yes stop_codon:yes gene_type:complete